MICMNVRHQASVASKPFVLCYKGQLMNKGQAIKVLNLKSSFWSIFFESFVSLETNPIKIWNAE